MRANGGGYYNRGYGAPYGGAYGGYAQNRVLGITNVMPRSGGALRVHGVWGAAGAQGYGQAYGYGQPYGYDQGYYGVQRRFSCRVDARGRVVDLDLNA